MKYLLIAGLMIASSSAFCAEKISMSAGQTVTVRGERTDFEVTCEGSQATALPVCTIALENSQFLIKIDGVIAEKTSWFEDAQRTIRNLKRDGICR